MGRVKNHKPGLHETGYLTSRAMVKNLDRLFRAYIAPTLGTGAVRETSRILDVGCGEQPYREMMGSRSFVGVNIEATNAHPDVVGDGLHLPFRDESFPAAVCTQVIEHVPDPNLLLREIARALKPNAMLLLSGPMYWPLHEEPYDFWRFTRYGMKRILEDNGFELVELCDDGNAVAVTIASVNHLFPGRRYAPLRMVFNVFGLALQSVFDRRYSTPNLSLVARRRP